MWALTVTAAAARDAAENDQIRWNSLLCLVAAANTMIAMAVLLAPGRVYRVLYLAGRGGQGTISDGIRRLPAAQVLRELLEGFDPAP